MIIDMWYGDPFAPGKYYAIMSFYPHRSFGYAYRGNIFSEEGKIIGDFATNDSSDFFKNFLFAVPEEEEVS